MHLNDSKWLQAAPAHTQKSFLHLFGEAFVPSAGHQPDERRLRASESAPVSPDLFNHVLGLFEAALAEESHPKGL